jgi:hypothetical protein
MKIIGHHKEVSWRTALVWVKQVCLGSETTNKIRDADATNKSVLLIGLGTSRVLRRGRMLGTIVLQSLLMQLVKVWKRMKTLRAAPALWAVA